MFFFFKQKTAYEVRISDWSSDVCSSDLRTEKGAYVIQLVSQVVNVLLDPAGHIDHLLQARDAMHRRAPVLRLVLGFGTALVNHYQSAERRVGKASVRTCRSRWPPDHSQKTTS